MGEVFVVHDGARHALQLEGADCVEVFKYQVFSVTGVEPDALRFKEVDLDGKDALSLEAAGIKPGMTLTIVAAASANHPQQPPRPSASPVRNARWRDACTRVYFACDDLHQPPFTADGISDGSLCLACATTCRLPNTVRFDAAPRDSGFICACPPESCLFGPRLGAEMLNSSDALAVGMVEDMRLLANEMRASATDASSRQFAARLQSGVATALEYEKADMLARARAVVPVSTLEERARAVADPLPGRDEFLMQLCRWYKGEFFTWVNSPPCERCGSAQTSASSSAQPTPAEMAFKAGIVELHRCAACGHTTRFPRYNDPGKLLETRRGRCGEWANAFGLLCRAVGFDVRHVMDWTDHVWVEVFSEARGRWMHCDPCEATVDTPLMYECGWGKKLTYVVAFSRDGVADVTRRYTRDFAEVRKRRTLCTEEWLERELGRLTQTLRSRLPADVRRTAESRDNDEHDAFAAAGERVPHGAELLGRTSGSLAWRANRRELGVGTKAAGEAAGSGGGIVGAIRPTCVYALARPERPESQPPVLLKYEFDCDGAATNSGGSNWKRSSRSLTAGAYGKCGLVCHVESSGKRAALEIDGSEGVLRNVEEGGSGNLKLETDGDAVVDACYAPRGAVLYAVCASGTVRAIDVASGRTIAATQRKAPVSHDHRIACVPCADGSDVVFLITLENPSVQKLIVRAPVTSVASGGDYFRDGGVATSGARLVAPLGMAVAPVEGSEKHVLFVCDADQHCVFAFEVGSNADSPASFIAVAACGARVVGPKSVAVLECATVDTDTIRAVVAVGCTDALVIAQSVLHVRRREALHQSVAVLDRANGLTRVVCVPQAPTSPAATQAHAQALRAIEAMAPAERVRRLVQLFFKQVSSGCGRDACSTPNCRSNAAYAPPATPNDAAARAIQLAASPTAVESLCAGIDLLRL